MQFYNKDLVQTTVKIAVMNKMSSAIIAHDMPSNGTLSSFAAGAKRWNKDSLKQNGCGASTMPDLMPLRLLDCRHFHLLAGSRVIEISSAEISVFIQRKENQNLFRLITGFLS